MNFTQLLNIIVTLFLLMVCGYICRRLKIIDGVSSKNLSRLIISVGQPMMIIAALNNAEYSADNLKLALHTTIISFAMHIFMGTAAFLICRRMKDVNRSTVVAVGIMYTFSILPTE